MNNYLDKCRPLALAAGLLCAGGAVAQVVLVPIGTGCVVVVPGVGGSIPLNRVGDGGIVCMNDPFDLPGAGGNFTFAGGTVNSWSMLGDISEQTGNVQIGPPPGAFPPDQSAGGIPTVNIQSYNKEVRLSEVGAPTLARSKGEVTVLWDDGVCRRLLTFSIFKRWAGPIPAIVGPNCWGTPPFTPPNNLITFSVDQVSSDNGLDPIGFDQYYWRLTNGVPGATGILANSAFYTSADRSSITIDQTDPSFVAWRNAGGPYTIQTCFGRCNPWDGGTGITRAIAGSTCVTKTMNPAQVNPNFTYTGSPCVPWNTFSFSGTYTAVGGHTYSWVSSCGWVLTPGVGTLAVSGMNSNPCVLTLTDVGPCGTFTYNYTVNRSFNTALVPALTSGTNCTPALGTFTIALPVAAQGNCTNWTISPVPVPAWTFMDANVNLRSIRTYTIPAAACAGSYTITAANCSCPGNSASVAMNVRPNAPTLLTGNTCVPFNLATPLQNYSCTAPCLANGALTYNWANTLGMTGSSTTNSIGYTPVGTATPGTVTVSASIVAGCTSPVASRAVSRTPPTPTVIPPCVNVGLPGTATFSVLFPVLGVCYTWNFPAGFCTPTTGTGSSITVTTTGTPIANPGYPCSVTANNCAAPFCGPVPFPFNVPVAYSTVLTVNNIPDNPLTIPNDPYSIISANSGCTSYQLWNCTTPGAVGLPQPGNSFNLNTPGVAGSYSIVATCGGCQQLPPCEATANSQMPLQGGGSDAPIGAKSLLDDGSGVILSPNPNNGSFTLTLLSKVETASATLFNANGQQVGSEQRLTSGNNQLGDEDLASGIYIVRIVVNGEIITRQVAVSKE